MWLDRFLRSGLPWYLLFAYIALTLLAVPSWMQDTMILNAVLQPRWALGIAVLAIGIVMGARRVFPTRNYALCGVFSAGIGFVAFALCHYLALQGYSLFPDKLYLLSTLGAILAFLVATLGHRLIYKQIRVLGWRP